MVEKALERGPARVLREALRARRRRRRAAGRAGASRALRDPGRLPLPLRRRVQGGGAARRRRARSATSTTSAPRPTARSCCAARAAPGARRRTKAAARSTTTRATRSTSSNFIVGAPSGGRAASFATASSRATSTTRSTARCTSPTARAASSASTGATRAFARCRRRSSVWGTNGRVTADRQECQLYLREPHAALPGRRHGLDGALHDRPDRGGLVLPARRGVFGADRLLRAEHPSSAGSTARTRSARRSTPTGSSR